MDLNKAVLSETRTHEGLRTSSSKKRKRRRRRGEEKRGNDRVVFNFFFLLCVSSSPKHILHFGRRLVSCPFCLFIYFKPLFTFLLFSALLFL